MLSSVEQAFAGRDEKLAPLKMPAWEAIYNANENIGIGWPVCPWLPLPALVLLCACIRY